MPWEDGPDIEESAVMPKASKGVHRLEGCVENTFCASRHKGFCVWFEMPALFCLCSCFCAIDSALGRPASCTNGEMPCLAGIVLFLMFSLVSIQCVPGLSSRGVTPDRNM